MLEEQGIFGGERCFYLVAIIGVCERKCWRWFCLLTDVTTDEWAFYLLPLDDDIISMELPEFFQDNFLVNKGSDKLAEVIHQFVAF